MSTSCRRPFDEALLSGYLDGALIQLDEQRVRLHLASCAQCRHELAELGELRDAARSTRFVIPDLQWDERPRGGASRLLRGGGWLLFVVAVATAVVLAARRVALFGGLAGAVTLAICAGLALLLLSVLIDRLRVARTDPYNEVHK